jgi:hypothetical protein
MKVSRSLHIMAHLSPGKSPRLLLNSIPDGPPSRSKHAMKRKYPPPGTKPRFFRDRARQYTERATGLTFLP